MEAISRLIRRLALVLAVVATSLVAPGAAALASQPPADTARAPVAPEVETKAAEGEVPVIAVTHVPGEQVADSVAATLPEGSASGITAGPARQLALSVDAAGLDALAANPDVVKVVEDKPNRVTADPWANAIGLPTAQAAGWTGAGRTVAILDTGFQVDHPYLAGKVVAEACFSHGPVAGTASLCPGGVSEDHDPGSAANCPVSPAVGSMAGCEHGTHVAGIAAGGPVVTPSALTGVAPGASIIAVKVFTKDNNSTDCGGVAPCLIAWDSDIVAALTWLNTLRGASDPLVATLDSVNLSLGGGAYSGPCDGANPTLTSAIGALRTAGVATAVATGNNGLHTAGSLYISSPACISTAVSVAATDTSTGSIAFYSNLNAVTTILAPGSSINSSLPGGSYGYHSGTSMATPVISGAIAVLRQRAPSITVSALVSDMQATGSPISTAAGTMPQVQLDAALAALPDTVPSAPQSVSVVPSDSQLSVSWAAPAFVGTGITGYSVSASPGGASCSTATTSCPLTGLANGTTYTVTVTASNAAGPGAGAKAMGAPRTVPSPPQSVTVVPDDGLVTVSWLAPTNTGGAPITGYTVTGSPGGSCGTAGATTCVISSLTDGVPYTFVVTASNVAGTGPGSAATGPVTPNPGMFTPIDPIRVLDTRLTGIPLGASSPLPLKVAGVNGVPLDAVAVVANVTVTEPTASSYLTVYPAGSGVPVASNLNFVAGQTVPNLVVAKVGSGGNIMLFNSFGTTHVVVDIVGYYTATTGTSYTSVSPARILDTRPSSALGPSTSRRLKVTGAVAGGLSVPDDAVAVVANVTVTEPTAPSYLTVYPDGITRPTASNLNYVAGQTVPNLVTVKVGTGGYIDLFNASGSTHVVVDIVGYYGPLSTGKLTSMVPTRILDTRPFAAVGASLPRLLAVAGVSGVPNDAVAVVANVTVTEPTAPSYLTVYPDGITRPTASNLNYVAGQTVPNLVTVKVGTGGYIDLFNAFGSTQVVVDVVGYYRVG